MFDPSKLNLDLDEKNKVSKINTKEEIKAELEKVEQVFDNKDILKEETQKEKENLEQEEKDILWDVNKSFIENDLEINKIKKEEEKKEEHNEKKELKNVVWDINDTIIKNKELDVQIKKELDNSLIDINIKSLQNIFDIMLKNDSNIFVFEPRDNDIKIIFRDWKIEKDIKYIKFPIYSQILLKAKALTKMKVEETTIEQNWKWEIQIIDSKYNVTSKTVPSSFWEKILVRINKLEKKVEKKWKENVSLWKLFLFLWMIAIIALIIWWAFIWFIVANAKTLEDVKFFYSLWINLNEINSFIWTVVTVVFTTLVFIETVFLAMYAFKAMLTKKIYKSKKIAYSVFAIVLLIMTITTWTIWMTIHNKITNLPNWQVMAQWDVQIFDNSKLLSWYSSKSEALVKNTTWIIWPVNLKFDLNSWEYKQKSKWFKIEKYVWSFGWKIEEGITDPYIIKNFDKIGISEVVVDIIWTNAKWEKETKTITNISSIGISNIVTITEKIDKLWSKTVRLNANNLKNLWEIEWYFIVKNKKGELKKAYSGYTGYDFFSKSIVEDTMIWILIKREWKESKKLDKIFVIKKQEKSTIEWQIKFTQDPLEDLKYSLYVENPDTAFGNGFVETFTWKIEDEIKKKESDSIGNPEDSSKITHIFKKHWKQEVSVELKDSSWKIKSLITVINIPKRLKLKKSLRIYNDWEEFTDFRYTDTNHEYFIDELPIPTKLRFDSRNIRTDNIFYKLDEVSWDLDDDWTVDKITKILEFPVDVEWNSTVVVKYKFVHRKVKDDIVNMSERIYIESIKKDAILKLKIIPEKKYVPTFVRFDASLTQIKWKNIEKFIFDYWDWTAVDERDAINPAHKYILSWEYDIKLTVVTTDWNKYDLVKKLVLNSKPQEANIKVSMKETITDQEIDFSSELSEWQITWYFWDFWDWEVSTDANPWHSFDVAWKYTVKLKVTFQNNNVLEDEVDIEIIEF
jgi:PKD repeat protein